MSELPLLPTPSTPHRATFHSDDFPTRHLGVRRVRGREAISELYCFEVMLVSTACLDTEAPIDPDDIIGASATLSLVDRHGAAVRDVSGIIESARLRGDAAGVQHAVYEITIVPRAHMLSLVTRDEIFLDLSVPEIIQQKLDRLELYAGSYVEKRLLNEYPRLDFVVQYGESDLAFISRLAENAGISFHFEQTDEGEKLVFSDHNAGKPALLAPVELTTTGNHGGVKDIAVKARMVPTLYIVDDYNHQTPLLDLARQRVLEDGSGGGVVEFGSNVRTPDEAQRIADVRAEESRSKRRVASGESAVGTFRAGLRFTLDSHPFAADGELLLTAVTHELEQTLGGDDAAEDGYRNHFTAVSSANRFRPARVTPQPRIHGVITATIQVRAGAEVGADAELDSDGCYLVQLHCDTPPAPTAKASHRIRLATPFAGPDQGMHFPLRPGTEVLVAFINGDPDRPVIVGAVANAVTPNVVTAANNHMHRIQSHHGLVVEFGKTLAT
jgi:type VI secretion system secreted protein VgrG